MGPGPTLSPSLSFSVSLPVRQRRRRCWEARRREAFQLDCWLPPPGGTFPTVRLRPGGEGFGPPRCGTQRGSQPRLRPGWEGPGPLLCGTQRYPATLKGSFLLPDISARNYTLHKHLYEVAPQVNVLVFWCWRSTPKAYNGFAPVRERGGHTQLEGAHWCQAHLSAAERHHGFEVS